ncbi:MAG: universal stress protein, partial [Aquincola tertiaricarbonis]
MKPPLTRPRSLLVATDLSSRCDRAIDRAVLLAREWGARLVVVTVPERAQLGQLQAQGPLALTGEEAELLQAQARRRLQAELGEAGVPYDVQVAHGPVGAALLKVADEQRCDLIVTGTARAHGLGRLVLGSTVDLLVRRSPVPVLVVRQRGRRAYPRLIVASDWSPPSRHALEVAATGWPEAPITLFHAFGAAYPARAGVDLASARDAGGEQ